MQARRSLCQHADVIRTIISCADQYIVLIFLCGPLFYFLIQYYILFTKSRGYSNIINHSIFQTNAINLQQLVLISQVI